MKIALVDTYYPEFLKCWFWLSEDYETELKKLLSFAFGTFDAYSRSLRALGWQARDIIANCPELQKMWDGGQLPSDTELRWITLAQIEEFQPDVVFLQDLSFFSATILSKLKSRYLVAGQCSCPMPDELKVKQFDCLFSSFPHYLPQFRALGVKAHYLPLAFEPDVLTRALPPKRELGCIFAGGVGAPSHWAYGMEVLETVAAGVSDFAAFGYGCGTLEANSAVRAKHRGQAWGLEMYHKLRSAKIVLNRHGEVSGPFANNLRLFEATGAGALLLTEYKENLSAFFEPDEVVTYNSPEEAAEKANYYLKHWEVEGQEIATRGQLRTLRDHTYANRMPIVSDVLKQCLKSRNN